MERRAFKQAVFAVHEDELQSVLKSLRHAGINIVEAGSEFQKKYFAAMQQSPEVVLGHSEFASVLGSARLSKEIH